MAVSDIKSSITQRSDGQFEGQVPAGFDENGDTIYKSVVAYNYPSLRHKMKSLAAENQSNETVDFYEQKWLETAERGLKESTSGRYRRIYEKYIKPVIGTLKCSELTHEHIDKIAESCAGCSEKTMALILSVLKLIIDHARSCGCSVQIDLQGFTAVWNKEPELRILDKAEFAKLSTAVLLAPDLTSMCIFLCMNTGIRLGELCALKREDIDFDKKTLSVTKIMQRVQRKSGETKTAVTVTELSGSVAKRVIPVPEFVVKAVRPHFEHIEKGCWLTTGTSTSYVEPRTMENRLKRICDEVELSDINFLALRHTFATRCAEVGVDSYALSLILGLSNVTQVVKMYYKAEMAQMNVLEKLKCC